RVIPEIAVGIGAECVTTQVPAVADVLFLPLVVEITAAGRTAHREPPDFARRDIVHALVNNARTKSRQWTTDRARWRIIRPHRKECMQHFSRAYAVEQIASGCLLPIR